MRAHGGVMVIYQTTSSRWCVVAIVMARDTFVDTATGGLDADLKLALKRIFTYVLNNLRFGQPTDQERSENFQGVFL